MREVLTESRLIDLKNRAMIEMSHLASIPSRVSEAMPWFHTAPHLSHSSEDRCPRLLFCCQETHSQLPTTLTFLDAKPWLDRVPRDFLLQRADFAQS